METKINLEFSFFLKSIDGFISGDLIDMKYFVLVNKKTIGNNCGESSSYFMNCLYFHDVWPTKRNHDRLEIYSLKTGKANKLINKKKKSVEGMFPRFLSDTSLLYFPP